jgi:uncharacterized protein
MGWIIFIILSVGVSLIFKARINKYMNTPNNENLSGAEIARLMLNEHDIHDVEINPHEGMLSDHYNPGNKTVNLSPNVYYGRSIASMAIAAHECGHAVQHAERYGFLKFRSAMVPLISLASQFMSWLIIIGILLVNTTPVPLTIGIAFFALTTFFSFITLPVEFDASKRALSWINSRKLAVGQDYDMTKDALNWAAMTYVVAALGSLYQLFVLVSLLMGRRE